MTNAIGCVAGAAVAAAGMDGCARVRRDAVQNRDREGRDRGRSQRRRAKDLGGDAGGIAKAIAPKGSLTLWQYAVTEKDGKRMVAPRAKIGVVANTSLRVEPYKQPFKVLAHE